MTNRQIVLAIAAVLFAVGVWIGSARAGAPTGAPAATVTAQPAAVVFGDAFTLQAVVPVADAGAVVLLDPAPFTALAPARTTTSRRDGATVVTVSERVACLSADCLPGAKGRTVRAGRVSVRANGKTTALAAARAEVRVTGRVPAALARNQDGGYRTSAATGRPTWGIAPGALVAILLGVAAVLVLGALGLLWPDARRRLAGRLAGPPEERFARALRLLRESAQRPAPDRRRAADLVARLTGGGGDDATAQGALRLAWGRPEPAPGDAIDLAERAERERGSE